jgi:galactose mutarotase-like enzyme
MGKQILENDELLVEIDAHGGELSRIYDKRRGREVLHDANPAYWNRHAPVLFPMVGASFDKTYRHGGVEYTMGQHGFARDSEFTPVESQNPENCKLYALTDSPETLAKYPFRFRLLVGHELNGRTLTVHWMVENPDAQELLFNIGAHPAFLLGEGAGFQDVKLDFHQNKALTYYRIEDPGSGCCYVDQPHKLSTKEGIVQLNDDFFAEGVYIFQDGSVQDVTMLVKDEPVVRITAPGFPYFGVWSKSGAPFICLEPWHGRTDAYGYTGDLAHKEGIIKLAPGAVFETSYKIEIC